ncbi:hypothetical protein HY969_04930 [Candidatus Kaiserbacteria bacterium]|nr:hypothetical protein [Candidatus Kaiserbacteria bacterium]
MSDLNKSDRLDLNELPSLRVTVTHHDALSEPDRQRIYAITHENFRAQDPHAIDNIFKERSDSVIAILRDPNGVIQGYCLASPALEPTNMHLYLSAIPRKLQREGLISIINREMDRALLSKGFLTTTQTVSNPRYAEIVRKEYAGSILLDVPSISGHGAKMNTFFKIKIPPEKA